MPNPDLCTEEEFFRLVHAFHGRVREDAACGPILVWHGDQFSRSANPPAQAA